MSKFTPGPWHIDTEPTSGWPITRTGKHYISSAPMRGERYGDEMADLNLIAAAPEMYEALKRLTKWCDENINGVPAEYGQIMDAAETALAKANGGQQ